LFIYNFSAKVLAFLIGYFIKKRVFNKNDFIIDIIKNILNKFDIIKNDVFF